MEAYPRGLILEESDGDVAKVGVQYNALGIVGVAARLRAAGRPCGGLGGGAGGRSIVVLVLAEHRLEFVHCVCWFDGFGVLEKLLSDDVKGREGNIEPQPPMQSFVVRALPSWRSEGGMTSLHACMPRKIWYELKLCLLRMAWKIRQIFTCYRDVSSYAYT